MQTTSVSFRGEVEDVEFIDHGYEPDTGAHEIEWWFARKELNELATDSEQIEILETLYRRAAEGYDREPDDAI